MSKHKDGSVETNQTIKAGCGIRFDPDKLDEESGFDFSLAETMKPNEETNKPTKNQIRNQKLESNE